MESELLQNGIRTATVLPGVVAIPVPTPFNVGAVNVYLLEGKPLTLVDCGPASAAALVAVEDALAKHGHRVADIELILLTHGHVDHAGLAAFLAARSGAEVACLEPLADELEDWSAYAERNDDYAASLLIRSGVPPQVASALHVAGKTVRALGTTVPVGRRLADGDVIAAGGRALRVLHRPGHSRWDAIFVDEEAAIGFLGDHLIEGVSTNASLSRPPGDEEARGTPLLDLRGSLRATAELGLSLGLAGHNEPIGDVATLVARRLDQQDARAERLLELLRSEGPTDAHTLACLLLGEAAINEPYLAVCEVIGHLDLLIEKDLAIEHETQALCQFEAL